MFTPAISIRHILSWNDRSTTYFAAAEMNISDPATTATAKHPQVQGRTSFAMAVIVRSFQERPKILKSSTAIDPTTSAIAMTWIDSMVGNAQVDWLMVCA